MIDPITEQLLKQEDMFTELTDRDLVTMGVLGGASAAVGAYKGIRMRQRFCKERTKNKEDYKKCLKRPKQYKDK